MSDLTANQDNLDVIEPRNRKISSSHVRAIANLVAKRLTETEACYRVGIEKVARWWQWKARAKNKQKFEELLGRMQAEQINAHILNIEDAEKGKSGHRPDWRASAHLLALKDRSRFGTGDAAQAPVNASIITDDALKAILDRVYTQKSVVECPVKELKTLANSDANDGA